MLGLALPSPIQSVPIVRSSIGSTPDLSPSPSEDRTEWKIVLIETWLPQLKVVAVAQSTQCLSVQDLDT